VSIGLRTTTSGGFRFEASRRFWIWRHTFVAQARSSRTWVKALMWFVELIPLLVPLLALGLKRGMALTGLVIGSRIVRAWQLSSPAHMQLLRRNYGERKLKLYTLLQDLQRTQPLTPDEVGRFQQEALALIANYVRDHRADRAGTLIYVNLLVEDGDDLVVVARDQPHRDRSARYPKSLMLATHALVTQQAATVGDVYVDFPDTPTGKPYRSIMVVPVVLEAERRAVGVVSIDSSQPYHFETDFKGLVTALMPYACLLAWTLKKGPQGRPFGG
jgi:hypothetical protein